MSDISIETLQKTSESFKTALKRAELMSTDQLLEAFNELDYPAWGHAAVMLWKICDQSEIKWHCRLRNEKDGWKEDKPAFSAKTPQKALAICYAWCYYKEYFK